MKRNISMIACSALVLFSASLFGDERSQPTKKTQAMPVNQGEPMTGSQMVAGYNHPARVNTTSDWDMFLTAKYLYWNVFQEGMEIGPLFTDNPATTNREPTGILTFDDTYRSGFKLGLGWNTPFDDWVVTAEYTWFRHDVTQNQPGSSFLVSNFLQAKTTPFDYATEHVLTGASNKWKIDLDVVDLMVSRPFYQGTRLTVNPSFGLRGVLLNQKYTITGTIHGTALNPRTAYGKTDSWAVGPAVGLGGNFLLGAGFRMIGSVGGALTFTRYNAIKYFAQKQVSSRPDLNIEASAQNRVRAIGDAQAGLGWGTYLCNQRYHLDFSATYEFQVYWNQNMINWYSASLIGLNGASPGNLYFQVLPYRLLLISKTFFFQASLLSAEVPVLGAFQ